MVLILCGLALIAFTIWDWQREETSAGIFSVWLGWLNISREDSPLLYQFILLIQLLLGVAGVVLGLMGR